MDDWIILGLVFSILGIFALKLIIAAIRLHNITRRNNESKD